MKATNSKDFESIVEYRANERVQAKIKAFRADVHQSACKNGFINRHTHFHQLSSPQMATLLQAKSKEELEKALDALSKDPSVRSHYKMLRSLSMRCFCSGGKWAESLWMAEKEEVRSELLSTLDEMQRALLAASKERDVSEGEPEPEGGAE